MTVRFFRPVRWAASLLLLVPPSGGAQVFVTKPDVVRKYALSKEDFPNPERGVVRFVNLAHKPHLKDMRSKGVALVQSTVYLDSFRSSPIDAAFLAQVEENLKALRAAGLKVVLRFAYSKQVGEPDAPKAWVLKHIHQLKPLIQANVDVIAIVQAGFIGAWGEWHASSSDLDNDASRREILQTLLAAVPPSRMVQVRRPAFKKIVAGNAPLSEAEAFSGTARARVGHHNDAFFASDTDLGTYSDKSQKDWTAQDSHFVAVGGETSDTQRRGEPPAMIAELGQLHWSFLHWRFPEDFLRKWDKEGYLGLIQRSLGYRFTVIEASWTAAVRPGGEMKLRVRLRNDGFAAPFNRRPVYVVLEKGDTRYAALLKQQDPRRWRTGSDVSFSARLGVPVKAPSGKYRLALWLPDEAAGLAPRPEYAIRLANDGMWDEATGLNVLSEDFKVDPNGTGGWNPRFKDFAEVP